MHELICPNCKKPFTVNEDDYAAILSQVKGAEFNAEVDRRIAELHKQQEAEQKARDAQAGQEHQKELSAKDKVIGEKDSEILRLKEQISAMSDKHELELSNEEITFMKAYLRKNGDMPFWTFEYENEALFNRMLEAQVAAILSYVNNNVIEPGEEPFTEETIG